MKTRNLSVLAVLPVLLLASCTSSSPLSENDTAETKQAYENLETDDLSKVTVTEYRYEGDTLYSRSVTWNGEKKLPSLLLALAREDKTGKKNYAENDGFFDTSLYHLYFRKRDLEKVTDCLYIQNSSSAEEMAGYSVTPASGKAVDAVSYIFKGLSEDASKETASVRKDVAAELAKKEFSVYSDPVC